LLLVLRELGAKVRAQTPAAGRCRISLRESHPFCSSRVRYALRASSGTALSSYDHPPSWQLLAHVSLEPLHVAAHVLLEIERMPVLGRKHDAELVLLTCELLLEDGALHRTVLAVQRSSGAVALNPLPLEVAEVQLRRFFPNPSRPERRGL
jgi:hypothetical protein